MISLFRRHAIRQAVDAEEGNEDEEKSHDWKFEVWGLRFEVFRSMGTNDSNRFWFMVFCFWFLLISVN
jgi:hypothetical protein